MEKNAGTTTRGRFLCALMALIGIIAASGCGGGSTNSEGQTLIIDADGNPRVISNQSFNQQDGDGL